MLLERILFIGVGTIVLFLGYRLSGIMVVAQFSILCSFLLLTYWILQSTKIELHIRIQEWKAFLKESVPFGLGAVCIIVLYREDTLMLNWLRGDGETGIYSAAFRLMEGTLLVPQAIALAAYPTLSRIFHEGAPIGPLRQKLQQWLLIFSLPLLTGGIILAPALIGMFTEEFQPSTFCLQVLLLALPAIFLNYLLGTVLRSIDRQALNLYSSIVALISNFLLNLLLIPPFGASGAGIATVCTQFIYFLMLLLFIRRNLGRLPQKPYLLKLLVSAIVMGVVIYPFRKSTVMATFFLTIPLGIVVFVGVAGLTRLLRNEDLVELRDFFRGQSS